MRRVILAIVLAVGMIIAIATAAAAGVSPTQPLPAAACNQGTMNAHENAVPETTGTGAPNMAHEAIPGTENVTPCGHGG